VFGWFKRTPPPVQWECGSSRHVNLLDALEHASDAKVSYFRDGQRQWTRDVAASLNAFTCHCVELVLEAGKPMLLPVYMAAPRNPSSPWDAAAATAKEQTEATTRAPLEQVGFRLPESFAAALQCKRRWVHGQASADDIRAAIDEVSRNINDNIHFRWPSGFCLHVNALQVASWCVLSALNIESPWLAAHGCAQTAATFLSCLAACDAMSCRSAAHDSSQLVWEAAQIGDVTFCRGVGCPQAGNSQAEAIATQAMQQTKRDWWLTLSERLAAELTVG